MADISQTASISRKELAGIACDWLAGNGRRWPLPHKRMKELGDIARDGLQEMAHGGRFSCLSMGYY
jgi:hypothetical protein